MVFYGGKVVGFLADFMADFLAVRSTTSFGSGKILGELELRVQGPRVDVVEGFETVVLNRRLGAHLAGLEVVCRTVCIC